MGWTLAAIAELVGGRLAGRADLVVDRIASPHVAGPRDLTLVVAPQQLAKFLESRAAAAIVPEGVPCDGRDVVHHASPYMALAMTLEAMYPVERAAPGVHPSAYVD